MTTMPFNTLLHALKNPSSAHVALSAVILTGAAVGMTGNSLSRATFQRSNTFSDNRLAQGAFLWPTPVGVTVSMDNTILSTSTSSQNTDSNTAQYVPPMLNKAFKHRIEFDGY
jgi:hypothetical protein